MNQVRRLSLALAILACTAFGAPVLAQVNSHYHPAIVVPALCSGADIGWTILDGHHVLAMSAADINQAIVGFEVLGNVQAVEHGVIPSTYPGRGPIEPGVFSFQVASLGPPSSQPLFSYFVSSDTGNNYQSGDEIPTNGRITFTVHKPSGTQGHYISEITFYLTTPLSDDLPARAVIGNFTLNGVALPASPLIDSQTSAAGFCNQI